MKRALSRFLLAVSAAALLGGGAPAGADEARPLADDPVAEKRLQSISAELRCLVCQNQTIADSDAALAHDFRREIRGMIQAGKSDGEIMDFMVARYGDFVRYRPPLKGTTLVLWGGPALLLLIGIVALVRYLRRRDAAIVERELTPEERAKADALLHSDKNAQ